jgi:hypothetical protein
LPSGNRIGATCFGAFLALIVAGAPAAAAPKRISGKLSSRGYTVIALAANGKASSVRVRGRGFRLRPPARRVTLHLRARNGRYAGPIVVRRERRGRRAILGVRAGASLGRIRVRRGYAILAKRLRKRSIDASAWAQARRGVPLGARRFGRVRSRHGIAARKRVRTLRRKLSRVRRKLRRTRSTRRRSLLRRQIRTLTRRVRQAQAPRSDPDLDGIPDPLDIDDDGDLTLDNLDRSPGAQAAQAESGFGIHSDLGLPIYDTANANAPGSTEGEIEATLPRLGILNINILPGDSAELDCGVLVYCSRGGTGRVPVNRNPPSGPPFPECCDADGDGFGTLATAPGLPPGAQSLTLLHGANTAQIRTGDVLIQRVTTGGVESQFPASVQFVFASGVALVSYADTAGNSATVPYPVAGYQPGPPGPGTNDNPFAVAAGPDGNVVLRLTFWRPQRRPIPPEPGAWTDIGGLTYATGLSGVGLACPQSALSTTDPNLTPSPVGGMGGALAMGGGFRDLAPDRPASTANTFTYTLNVTQCLASLGRSWSPGQTLGLDFVGLSGTDQVEQGVAFKRQ